MDGRSLVPALRGEALSERATFVESDINMFPENPRRKVNGVPGKWRSICSGNYKLILIPEPEGESLELYDLEKDKGETKNLVAAEPEKARSLRQELDVWLRSAKSTRDATTEEMDEGTRQLLKTLGYLD
jgi:arylsulfatase A-like enzyme